MNRYWGMMVALGLTGCVGSEGPGALDTIATERARYLRTQ